MPMSRYGTLRAANRFWNRPAARKGHGLMPKLPPMTVREVEAILQRAGFDFVRQTDHRIWRHSDGRGISIPAHRGDLRPGRLRSIVEQSGLTVEQFLELR